MTAGNESLLACDNNMSAKGIQMPKHADDEPVMVSYAASSNITFKSREPEELGPTWGEWREMNDKEKNEAFTDYLFNLVDVWVEGDED